MRRSFIVLLLVGFALALLTLFWPRSSGPTRTDLAAWAARAADQDWTSKATAGDPEAQFILGMGLIRTNLLQMVDRVPRLASVPIIGRRFFETVSYALDSSVDPQKKRDAQRWISKAAAQGFPPAQAAQSLFPPEPR